MKKTQTGSGHSFEKLFQSTPQSFSLELLQSVCPVLYHSHPPTYHVVAQMVYVFYLFACALLSQQGAAGVHLAPTVSEMALTGVARGSWVKTHGQEVTETQQGGQ